MTRKGADYFNVPLESQNVQNKALLKMSHLITAIRRQVI